MSDAEIRLAGDTRHMSKVVDAIDAAIAVALARAKKVNSAAAADRIEKVLASLEGASIEAFGG